ncbi:endonuclease domain-containing protein [Rhizobium sp. NPDC090279]|uniref:endonuclease domain-containing protein n=1 Tax=Rhizobium sp. NPDC090279 TaxID=3364499 RepID=UPI00383B3B27
MRGPEPKTTQRARMLRQSDNDAEAKLWSEPRNRRLNNFKFVRQFPIGRYFADFACRERSLVIEIDGSQHAESRRDTIRDEFMTAEGWSIARFWNIDVLTDMPAVLETIVAICEGRLTEAIIARDFKFLPAACLE